MSGNAMSGLEVNSEEYWDTRFKNDWDAKSGDQQSTFFMKLALDMLPNWLTKELKEGNKKICDWGCAEGDGTSLFAAKFDKCLFEGIDFSETAIETAKRRYQTSNLTFTSKDLLTTSHDTRYDIVFSSNVFEHFHNPWQIFEKINGYARELFIMMVPFEEDPENMVSEHFHRFDAQDFLLDHQNWSLVYLNVVNAEELAHTQWPGKQALAIFINKSIINKKKLEASILEVKINLLQKINIDNEVQTKALENTIIQLKDELERSKKKNQTDEKVIEELSGLVNSKRFRAINKIVALGNKTLPPSTLRRKIVTSALKTVIYIKSPTYRQTVKYKLEQTRGEAKFKRDLLKAASKHRSTVVYMSMPWDHTLRQRPHHMAEQLAKLGLLIVYIDTDAKHSRKISDNLFISKNDSCFETLSKVHKIKKFFLLHSTNSYPLEYLKKINTAGFQVIYEYIDEIDGDIEANPHSLRNQLNTFKRLHELRPVLLLASAKVLYDQLQKKFSGRVMLSENAVDVNHFNYMTKRSLDNAPKDIKDIVKKGKPVVGYYGAMAPWLDYQLINKLAKKRLDLNFVFIGPDYNGGLNNLKRGKNIFYLGPKDYSTIPDYSYWFDCAMIPFKRGEIAKSTSPLKLFEYMAMGLPTVCTRDLRECKGYDYVYVAKTDTEFNGFIDKAINSKRSGEASQALLDQAAKNTWQARAAEIYNRIVDL